MSHSFDPLAFGFVKLPLQLQGLRFYEHRCGPYSDGELNPHRITTYLTQDGSFVTVWHGLFDPMFVGAELRAVADKIGDMGADLFESYQTPLFRGHIVTEAEARVILKALRYDGLGANTLQLDRDGSICCDPLPSA